MSDDVLSDDVLNQIRDILLPDHKPIFMVKKSGRYFITISCRPGYRPAIECGGNIIWAGKSIDEPYLHCVLRLNQGEVIELMDANWMTVRQSIA